MTADSLWRLKDILDLYAEPDDPQRPVVCFDERPFQLLSDSQPPLPMKPGQPRRQDDEYRRQGQCTLFLCVHPPSRLAAGDGHPAADQLGLHPTDEAAQATVHWRFTTADA